MIIDLKRSIDLRRLLVSGAIFISDDLVVVHKMIINTCHKYSHIDKMPFMYMSCIIMSPEIGFDDTKDRGRRNFIINV